MTATVQEVMRYSAFLRTQVEVPELFPHLTRLLAGGVPVSADQLAAAAGLPAGEVRAALEHSAAIEWTGGGRIVGYKPTPHTFTTGNTVLYATCASHALSIPVIAGRAGVAASACPVTGQTVRVQVTPAQVRRADPPETVVSKVRLGVRVTDIAAEICGLGSLFVSPQAAADWLEHHPGVMIVPVAEEFDIIRQAMTELGWAACSLHPRRDGAAGSGRRIR